MTPEVLALFQAVDATWAPFAIHKTALWTIRDGKGGGKRVSAASALGSVTASDVQSAETAMAGLGQTPLFMIRGDEPELDSLLDGLGYGIIDPVDILSAQTRDLAEYNQPKLEVIFTADPIAILAEIWAEGGIGRSRLDVMRRVKGKKTYLLGRHDNKPVASAFAAVHGEFVMVHAVEVRPTARRRGVARRLMNAAAWWGQELGAKYVVCLTTSENTPAQTLYRNMGMEVVAQYHYRIKKSQNPEAPMTEKSPTALDLPPVDPLPDATQKYFDLCVEKLGFVPNVLRSFTHNIDKLNAFTAMYNDLMLADSGLTKLEREMIAVVVSSINKCFYCLVAHGAAVRQLSGNPELGEMLVMNYRVAPLSKREKAMLDFAALMTEASHRIEEPDRQALRDVGLSDADIWDVAAVAAFFNMSNRLSSATDKRPNSEYHALYR